jgi:hypothetical protein
MPAPLPPLVAAYLSGDLPADPAARRDLLRRLDDDARQIPGTSPPRRTPEAQAAYDARAELYTWAHGEAPRREGATGPTLTTWAAVLGVSVARVKSLRQRDERVGALPVQGKGRRDAPHEGRGRFGKSTREEADPEDRVRIVSKPLPTCVDCGALATCKSTRTGRTWCDAHSPAAYWLREDLPQAAAVRARVTKDGER